MIFAIELDNPKRVTRDGPVRREESYTESIARLRAAQQTIEEELEPLQEAAGPRNADEALLHLYLTVYRLCAQADALYRDLNRCGATGQPLDVAEALSDFFWDTRRRIATML